jgi:type III restriction enzyme
MPFLKFDFTGIPIVVSLLLFDVASGATTSLVAALGIIARSGDLIGGAMKGFAEFSTVLGVSGGLYLSRRVRLGEGLGKGVSLVLGVAFRIIVMSGWNLVVLPRRARAARDELKRLFFCQLEAMETIIWQTEAPESSKAGIEIPGDGGSFRRLCCKMATGTGKTVVMAMLVAWQILNKATYPQDTRFTKYVFIVTPGLTIKSRLQVLFPDQQDNYYDEFNIVPSNLKEKLRQGKIKITNWHTLNWDTEDQIKKKRSVDKRGVKSDEAYTREVLGELSKSSRILVINDEGHHAWRKPANSRIKVGKEDEQMATIWINGLDRIQRTRGILTCYDFSATPYIPTGRTSPEDTLYDWIICDFNLNDAIESGLVKTPRIVIRDDAQPTSELRSRLYHIYNDPEVKDDLNRRAKENESLPSLVKQAYLLLGEDWVKTLHRWSDEGHPTPPVMITVANRTHTAARVKYAFDHKEILVEELNDPEKTLHIDSKVLKLAESQEDIVSIDIGTGKKGEAGNPRKKLSMKERAELLRQQVDTVGKMGKPGEQIQNVISVGMLTEGWDAKTVTHIMGLRAFTSQLLCEQVVGRGLRRTNYQINEETGLLDEEYVQIFGIPFQFLPHETADGVKSNPPQAYDSYRTRP